jgi:hypothetical protein
MTMRADRAHALIAIISNARIFPLRFVPMRFTLRATHACLRASAPNADR